MNMTRIPLMMSMTQSAVTLCKWISCPPPPEVKTAYLIIPDIIIPDILHEEILNDLQPSGVEVQFSTGWLIFTLGESLANFVSL